MSQLESGPATSADHDERELMAMHKKQVKLAMRRGEFAEVWKMCDAVLHRRGEITTRHMPQRAGVWNGTPLANRRVRIFCNHGLGDTLHFIRYAPLVRDIAFRVTVLAQPALLPLLRTMEGIEFLPLHVAGADCEYDVAIDVMELAHLFRTTIDTIPRSVPYLHAAPAAIDRDGRLAVGIVWRSGNWSRHRHVPFGLIESLSDVPDVALFSLQRDPDEFSDRVTFLRGVNDPLATAQLMRAMDLVITIDSMPAHLAGALGVPTWTLLPEDADWRWMDKRDDSPWYPTMRLFRQQRAGEWQPVIERVRDALTTVATRGRSSPKPVVLPAAAAHPKTSTPDSRTLVLSAATQLPAVDLEPTLELVTAEVEGQLNSSITGVSGVVRREIRDIVGPAALRQFKHAYYKKVLDFADVTGTDAKISPQDHATRILAAAWREFIDGRNAIRDFIGVHTNLLATCAMTHLPADDTQAARDYIAREALERYSLLHRIAVSDAIDLAQKHISVVVDDASPSNNIHSALCGGEATRSAYGTAPGGSVSLDTPMLKALLALTQRPYSYSFRVTEIAGGSHRRNSRHYAGAAFDVDRIDGMDVGLQHPQQAGFRDACSALGASLVLGPPDEGHPFHIHVEWPA